MAAKKSKGPYLKSVFGLSALGYGKNMAFQHGRLHVRAPARFKSLILR